MITFLYFIIVYNSSKIFQRSFSVQVKCTTQNVYITIEK